MSILRFFFRNVAISLVGAALFLATPPSARAQSTVYAMTNTGVFGTLNLSSGAFTQLGNSGVAPAGMGGFGNSLFIAGFENHTLYLVNPANGSVTAIGNGSLTYYDLGATPSSLYAIGTDSNLYTINAATGASTLVGPTGLNISGSTLGLSSNGAVLYLTVDSGSGSVLYSVNTTTGAATAIGNTELSRIDAMVYANGLLYAAPRNGTLYTLNTSTGAATFVANTGQIVWGLALPPFSSGQTSPPPSRLVNVVPCRLVDTRSQNNGAGFQGTQTFILPALAESGGTNGCAPFSLSTAQAYSLNVTLVPVHGHPVGYLTIWPTGEPQPLVSLLNSDGRIKANAAIVPAGTGGQVSVYVTDTTNVLIDIDAYFDAASDSSALAFFPLPPCRIIDTRSGDGGPLQAGVERDYPIPGNCDIPSTAQAYSFNVTVLPTQGELDYLTVWPLGETRPVVSTLNDGTGTIVANAAIVPAGPDSATAFYVHDHNTNLLLDVNGYFAPASSAPNPLSLFTLTPCRVLDTRSGIGLFEGTIPVGIVGSSCGVPGASPEAFVLNATVVPDGPLLYLQLWPEDGSQQGSTLNANDGAVTSNMAIVPAGMGNDSIDAYAFSKTNLILDIASYFAPVTAVEVQSSSPLPNGTLSQSYSVQLVATGGVGPYTWQNPGGGLPTGLLLTTGGLIQGTTTATGPFNFMVQATDSNSPAGTASARLQITVNSTQGTLGITTTSLPMGTVNTPYNALLAANGGMTPYTWSINSGSLPVGVTLNSATGLISGTPGAAGLSNVFIEVMDAQGHNSISQFSIAINTGDANGTLNGMYAGSFAGYNAGQWFVMAFSFTADGNGNITGGEFDENFAAPGFFVHGTISGGNYSIGSNGLGGITLTSNSGGVQLLVSTGAGEEMQIISFNQNGSQGTWGAGVLRQQDPADFNLAAGAGNWAFGFQGVDSSGNPLAGDGTYQEDSSGNFSGVEDFNDFGTHNQTTLTDGHTTSSIDSNGRVTSQVQLSGIGTSNLAHYIISANETVGIRIDNGEPLFTESNLKQSGTFNLGSLNGSAIGAGSREHNADTNDPDSQATVLQVESSGNGNISFAEDIYTVAGGLQQGTLTGTYTVASNSRTVITLSNGSTVTCYLIASNQGFCINTAGSGHDAAGAELTYFEPQVVPSGGFSDASFSGEYLGGSLPQYLSSTLDQIDSNVSSGAATFYSTYTQSGPGGVNQGQTLSGTYNVTPATGAITISVEGSPVYAGFLVSVNKVEYVTASGPNPLTLIEVTSSAP